MAVWRALAKATVRRWLKESSRYQNASAKASEGCVGLLYKHQRLAGDCLPPVFDRMRSGSVVCRGYSLLQLQALEMRPAWFPTVIGHGFSTSSAPKRVPELGEKNDRDADSVIQRAVSEETEEAEGSGWTREEILTWPNAISLSRLVLGPGLAWVIVQGHPGVAFGGMVIGGISDWLDGYVARRTNVRSVLGSYLDPLADKVLVGSVALSMAYVGLLHPGLVALMVGRDAVLVAGAFYYRAQSLGWKWSGLGEFFKINPGGAPKLKPIFISKVNTALQLVLISAALLEPAVSDTVDLGSTVWFLSWSVAATTVGSWVWYAVLYFRSPDSVLSKVVSEKIRSVSRRAAAAHKKQT